MADLSDKPFLRQIRDILVDGIRRIDNDECDEAKAVRMVANFNVESDAQYGKRRFVNYDQAMRITGIRSRGAFKRLCDVNGITQHSIGNHKIGFLKDDIEGLAETIREKNRDATKS